MASLDAGIFEAVAPPAAEVLLPPENPEEAYDENSEERSAEPPTEAEAEAEAAPEEAAEQAAERRSASQAETAVAPRRVNRWGGMKGARTPTSGVVLLLRVSSGQQLPRSIECRSASVAMPPADPHCCGGEAKRRRVRTQVVALSFKANLEPPAWRPGCLGGRAALDAAFSHTATAVHPRAVHSIYIKRFPRRC